MSSCILHLYYRDKDETPHYVSVEICLCNASFWITFSDASNFPPPIRIENLSNVPVLYQQYSETHKREPHLRTICKANSVGK